MKKWISILLLSNALLAAASATAQKMEVWKLADLSAVLNGAKEPTILNFWATFCKPCLAEMPHFQVLANRYKKSGVRLYFVSVDMKDAFPKKVASVARSRKISSPVVFLDETNADLFCPAVDSTWTGAIPATVFINNAVGYRQFFEAELSRAQIEAEIRKMLGKKPGNNR